MSVTWLRWWSEIIWPPKCVVGEADNFSRSETNCCSECGKIGDKFSLYFTLNLCSKLEENKQRFVKHWNKEHLAYVIVKSYLLEPIVLTTILSAFAKANGESQAIKIISSQLNQSPEYLQWLSINRRNGQMPYAFDSCRGSNGSCGFGRFPFFQL